MTETVDKDVRAALSARAREALLHWEAPPQEPVLIKYRENAVFRITLADGRHAALRLHRAGYHNASALHSELLWMEALHRDGLDVPSTVPARDGRILVELPPGHGSMPRHADVVSWLDGSPLGESGIPLPYPTEKKRQLFHRIGATMAELHNSADRWHVPPSFVRPDWNEDGILGDTPLWGRFWDFGLLSAQQREQLSDLRERLRHMLLQYTLANPDYGLIHADLVRENIFVSENGIAFIDFDDSGYGFRLFDIATALLKNRAEPDYAGLEAALVEGYRTRRPLDEADLRALPLFLALRSVTYIGWLSSRPEMTDATERLARYVGVTMELAKALEKPVCESR